MSVVVAYRADTVGPVVRKVVAAHEGLTAIHEDDIRQADLISPPSRPQPAPVDPLIAEWERTTEVAKTFVRLSPDRSEFSKTTLKNLLDRLATLQTAQSIPAPTPPPPVRVEPKVLIRWGSRWEGAADVEINTAQSVRLARDKRESRRVLADLGPKTWIRESAVVTPCVIRPRRHHAGKKFFVCRTPNEVTRAILKCGPGWYASELIDKSKEYRVFILQDRVIRISSKSQSDPSQIAWNVGVGGAAKGIRRSSWPIEAAKASLLAARRLGLDWTAIDVCLDKHGKVYVLEANTAPGLTGETAIEQIAWAFASVKNNPRLDRLDLSSIADWKGLLHPSLAAAAEE